MTEKEKKWFEIEAKNMKNMIKNNECIDSDE